MSENPYPNGTFLVWNGVRYVHERKCTEDKAAAIAAEREACAKIAEKLAGADVVYPEGIQMIAAAIRARGE